ncbi:P-loop NTPase fold protein [Cryobacterium sp. PH31-O1]|uniref:YobI family P-loop NTPase n=1 Tax=Cryobacterium sp. PH31-O1 TaxID=3046306 RepID=UPI0024BB764D|nr:P-loop NTPase fold protein [Cryobacterium sp. PH31-O1]MDJ0338670.1 P-loop NTPase fold protein [Cryobacterium sp. PH31-O1]
MSENVLPPLPGSGHGAGGNLYIRSLAPQFDGDQHQLYADLLLRALNTDGTKNIALTGAYGTGKSSILSSLRDTHRRRVVELSLSTIAPDVPDTVYSGGALSRTNQIQKELVKQLLYRLPASKVPQSRFRRASVPDKRRDWVIAGIGGAAAFVLLFGLGLIQSLVEALLPIPWRQWVAYGLLLASMVGATWTVLVIVRGRPVLSASVQTGPATITLSKQSETYFDEYLDEIVYFFQASRRDIVLIEDIDRFEDVQVFDTLRALNSLLNESTQIGRRIVFVYAIRDSVFEEIGSQAEVKPPTDPMPVTDRAKSTLKRASRTKFFDVIIPVVPFVSADNARDIMSSAMASDDFEINPTLIRLAARHVADMRMIHNIRNEFEVYRNRLIVTENRIPGIDDDLVFAIVLYKNTHLADFEKIRHRESSLDLLYSVWRALVQENIAADTTRLIQLRQLRRQESTAQARARRLGRQLEEFAGLLRAAAQASNPQATVELQTPATGANMEEPNVWAQIVAEGSQTIRLHNPGSRYQTAIDLSFSTDQLSQVLRTTINDDDWETVDLAKVDANIRQAQDDLEFLRHHTWQTLAKDAQLAVDPVPFALNDSTGAPVTKSISFDSVIDATLESDLAREMVRHGFLTSHFALYTASYYGNHLGPDAMEYIRRCIEPGEPDMTYEIGEDEVAQILREQGAATSDVADLFNDASIFNVSILDYLLSHRPEAASAVAYRLSRLDEQEQEFLDTYTSHGAHPNALLAAMAPHWKGVLLYIASPRLGTDSRTDSINAVLGALPHSHYETDDEVTSIIEATYQHMDAVTQPTSDKAAHTVLGVVKAAGATLTDLAPLNATARKTAVELHLFPLTEHNLRILIPSGPIALDTLRKDTALYQYAIEQLSTFLTLATTPPNSVLMVSDPKAFTVILTDIVDSASSTLVDEVVRKTDARFQVPRLDDVPSEVWPSLATQLRTDPTFENVSTYLAEYGLDASLAAFLNKAKKITTWETYPAPERLDVALAVLNARSELPSVTVRIRIARSIAPETIPTERIQPESGDLIAKLIRARLVPDDASTFDERLMIDWKTLAATIEASRNFATFASPSILTPGHIPALLRRPSIQLDVRRAVVSDLRSYLAEATRKQAFDIANALIETGWQLSYELLEALRTSGANTGQVVALIHNRGEDLSTDHMKTLLQALGSEYSRIASGGRGQPTFTVTDAHTYILNRLLGDTIKGIETKSFKLKGLRLVASLQT